MRFRLSFSLGLRLSRSALLAGLALASALAPCAAMVNHLPEVASQAAAKAVSLDRGLHGLNEVLDREFADLAPFAFWQHVGMIGMGSGIYLGQGRVLTSAHVGCYPFRLQDGSRYEPDYASWRILKNADGSKSDLAVFRIRVPKSSALARLASLPLAERRPNDAPILLLGTGFTQGKEPIALKTQGRSLGILGYRIQPRRSHAWCLNRGSQPLDSLVATGRNFITQCFTTRFERSPFAGQATDGDSGGAAFCYNTELGRWELAGCIVAVSQPAASVTFGCRTFLSDLAVYGAQLDASGQASAPKPASGAAQAVGQGVPVLGKKLPVIQARAASIR